MAKWERQEDGRLPLSTLTATATVKHHASLGWLAWIARGCMIRPIGTFYDDISAKAHAERLMGQS